MKRYSCYRCKPAFHTNSVSKWNIHREVQHGCDLVEDERVQLLEQVALIRQDMKELSQDETEGK